MESSADSATATVLPRGRIAVAVGLGVLLGGLARELPYALATLAVSGTRSEDCEDQAIAECALAAAPEAIGRIVLFGFIVVLVVALFAAGGGLLLAVGLRRHAPVARTDVTVDGGSGSDRPPGRLVPLTLGTALLVPVVWLLASFVTSM